MLRTIPAFSSTRRCLVIAWRVTFEPSASCEIDRRSPAQSLASSDNLVSSPRAAKTGACARCAATRLPALPDMALDVLHLLGPAPIVHAEGFRAPAARDLVEAGFGH